MCVVARVSGPNGIGTIAEQRAVDHYRIDRFGEGEPLPATSYIQHAEVRYDDRFGVVVQDVLLRDQYSQPGAGPGHTEGRAGDTAGS